MHAPTNLRRRRRPRFQTRPFFISTALILALVAVYTLVPSLAGSSRAGGSNDYLDVLRRDDEPAKDVECRLVHYAEDKCAFVRANCEDEDAGLLPYITFYYCSKPYAQPVAFAALVTWLGLLFTAIGIAASDFFSVNLGSIAAILGLSESLAGVTFLAFGNGSPDVFSTFAAMGSNSGSMAVGELIGAAGFITAVVAGSMALVREFKVSRRTYVRDICFFIASVSFTMFFLADGSLVLWECCVMIGFYLFYVMTVVGWHWVSSRHKKRRAREAASRAHFYGATIGAIGSGGAGDNDLAPYHDDDVPVQPNENGEIDPHDEPEPDDTAPLGGRRQRPQPDISVLERGPRIEVDSVGSLGESDAAFDAEAQDQLSSEEEQDRRNRHITAEVTSSMRVNPPQGRRRTTATTPIRPSLLGALEFRSVLASLQRSGTMHLAPIDRRRSTTQRRPGLARGSTVSALGGDGTQDPGYFDRDRARDFDSRLSRSSLLPYDTSERGAVTGTDGRSRALSSGDRPLSWADDNLQLGPPLLRYTDAQDTTHKHGAAGADVPNLVDAWPPSSPGDGSTHASTVSFIASTDTADGTSTIKTPLASPLTHSASASSIHQQHLSHAAGSGLHLHIPSSPQHSARLSPHSSPALSPFPGYTESPMPLSSIPPSRTPSLPLLRPGGNPADDGSSFPGLDGHAEIYKPIKWWPYNRLPAPHVIINTLFPSLIGWREKTIWDKFVCLISAPTVLLLVITLPVVDVDISSDEDEEEEAIHEYGRHDLEADGAEHAHSPLFESDQTSEWQRYRRSTLTARSVPTSAAAAVQDEAARLGTDAISSTAVSLTSAGASGSSTPTARVPVVPLTLPCPAAKPTEPIQMEVGATNGGWNRWLVAVQLVAGPLFTVFVVWANMAEDLERPRRDLAVMLLASLATSCVLLAVLLSTTTAQCRPKYHSMLCYLGFIISVAWISTVAGEVVGVLKAFGVIVGISEAILGLTIFAVGNSLGDLVADITVARLGYPVMALSACFGGPMLNILLGIGIGGAWMTIKAARGRSDQHPDQPLHYEPYAIEVGSSLLVSAVTVLVTLVFLLVAVPANGWVMSRKIGLVLIAMWTVSTVVNVILEIAGAW
ncbi:hypothetical protein SEPCBS57363_005116 [Sporothrix epigloea]|uniref:Sodium/calcium exchanger membrane region domain-containing protein n=1 Tax=Sporothrix epigloea TaxID=1892477 RepID=A0ABP0DVS0_9PEZI